MRYHGFPKKTATEMIDSSLGNLPGNVVFTGKWVIPLTRIAKEAGKMRGLPQEPAM
jgi:hypothetical protein